MPVLYLVQLVAESLQEIFVGRNDRAVHLKLDYRLRLTDGRDLAREIREAQLLLRHIGGILDHFEGFAVGIENRIVGGLNPDFFSALAEALVLRRLILATV